MYSVAKKNGELFKQISPKYYKLIYEFFILYYAIEETSNFCTKHLLKYELIFIKYIEMIISNKTKYSQPNNSKTKSPNFLSLILIYPLTLRVSGKEKNQESCTAFCGRERANCKHVSVFGHQIQVQIQSIYMLYTRISADPSAGLFLMATAVCVCDCFVCVMSALLHSCTPSCCLGQLLFGQDTSIRGIFT